MPSALGLLRRATRHDPARPRLTWYDDDSGERVELSGTTLLTWVAKTAHLLSGDLGLGPGDRLSVDLPRHWTAAVCWLAADAVGAQLSPVPGPAGAGTSDAVDVAVVGPDALLGSIGAHEVVAVSLRPMGAPFVDPLPPLVHDFSLEVRSQPDDFPFGPDPTTPAGDLGVDLAAAWALGPRDRVLVCDAWPPGDPVGPDLAAAWAADASVVWVRNARARFDVERWTAEQVTAVVAEPAPAGGEPHPAPPPESSIRVLNRPSVS